MRVVPVLAFLAIAAPAAATPLSLSQTDIVFEAAGQGGVRSAISVHIEDMAYPVPDIGQLSFTITGHVEEPSSRNRYLTVAGFEFDAMAGTEFRLDGQPVSVRTALGESVFSEPRMSAWVSNVGYGGYGDPMTYTLMEVRFADIDRRELDWTVNGSVLVFEAGQTSELRISSYYAADTIIPSCDVQRYCRPGWARYGGPGFNYPTWFDYQPLSVEVIMTPRASTMTIAAVPEPSTGAPFALGVLAMSAMRKRRWRLRDQGQRP
jgi:hypothetical protein